jgi:hypothetical protein
MADEWRACSGNGYCPARSPERAHATGSAPSCHHVERSCSGVYFAARRCVVAGAAGLVATRRSPIGHRFRRGCDSSALVGRKDATD